MITSAIKRPITTINTSSFTIIRLFWTPLSLLSRLYILKWFIGPIYRKLSRLAAWSTAKISLCRYLRCILRETDSINSGSLISLKIKMLRKRGKLIGDFGRIFISIISKSKIASCFWRNRYKIGLLNLSRKCCNNWEIN